MGCHSCPGQKGITPRIASLPSDGDCSSFELDLVSLPFVGSSRSFALDLVVCAAPTRVGFGQANKPIRHYEVFDARRSFALDLASPPLVSNRRCFELDLVVPTYR